MIPHPIEERTIPYPKRPEKQGCEEKKGVGAHPSAGKADATRTCADCKVRRFHHSAALAAKALGFCWNAGTLSRDRYDLAKRLAKKGEL